jgi:hypothetical protein
MGICGAGVFAFEVCGDEDLFVVGHLRGHQFVDDLEALPGEWLEENEIDATLRVRPGGRWR